MDPRAKVLIRAFCLDTFGVLGGGRHIQAWLRYEDLEPSDRVQRNV